MTTQTEQSIVEKVQAILDRANHPNTPQAEAEVAFAMAQKLITKYNLDESALARAKDIEEDIVHDTIDVFGAYALRRLSVCSLIAYTNSCATYRSTVHGEWVQQRDQWGTTGYKRPRQGYRLHLYGTPQDIFATKILWQSVEMLALRSIPKGDKSFRNSWWHGFGDGIFSALDRAKKDAVAESGDAGNALVLVNRRERADKEMRAKVKLKSAGASASIRSADAFRAGRTVGASFNTNGVGRGAVGALTA